MEDESMKVPTNDVDENIANVDDDDDDHEHPEDGAQVSPQQIESDQEGGQIQDDSTRKLKLKRGKLINDPKELLLRQAELKALDTLSLRTFVHQPLHPTFWIHTHVKRVKTGMTKLSRKFEMWTDTGVFLLATTKKGSTKTSYYPISVDREDLTNKDVNYVGKVRSNFVGSEWLGYGEGSNPKKMAMSDNPREEMAAVKYSSNLLGKKEKGPRRLQITLPFVNEHNEIIPCRALDPEKDGLIALEAQHSQLTTQGGRPLVTSFCSKEAKWNEKMKSYVLNFDNRVTEASVKNFQLTKVDDQETVYLQFGRVDKNTFNLDFRAPLTPFQAFTIAISSLDYKICSE